MFLVVVVVALLFAYIVNFTEHRATCLLSVSGPGPGGTAINTATNFASSQEFISAVMKEPGISDLAVITNQQDPETWLQQRLELDIYKPGSELLRIELVRYPYTDSGKGAEDYPLILDAVLQVLQRRIDAPDVNMDVLQPPTPPM